MKIEIGEFSGVAPKVPPRKLPQGMGQKAENTRFDRMRLEGFKASADTAVSFPEGAKSIHLYEDQFWMSSQEKADFVEAPLAVDPNRYLIIVDGINEPQITRNDIALTSPPYPTVTHPLNLPNPQAAPTIEAVDKDGPPDDEDDLGLIDVRYVVTYVDIWGRESQPSPVSSLLTYLPAAQKVRVTMTGVPQSPNDHPLLNSSATKRIYRTNTGTDGGVFQFVAEVDITDTVYDDELTDEELGEALPSVEWDPAPDLNTALNPRGPLHTLIAMPGSYLCGLTENEVCFSEVGVLHAWPVDFRQPIRDFKIVGAVLTAEGVFIGTEGKPFFAYGGTPASMALAQVNSTQSCVSKESIVNVDGVVLYASPDGLCAFSGGAVSVITQELFSQQEWQKLKPETIKGFYYEGMYIGFYDDGLNKKGFVFNPRGGKNAWSWLDYHFIDGYSDIKKDSLFLLAEDRTLKEFDAGTDGEYTWQSQVFRTPREVNFGLAQVLTDNYPVTLKVDARDTYGGVYTQTVELTSERPMYLESGFLAAEWEVELTHEGDVHRIVLATSFEEFD